MLRSVVSASRSAVRSFSLSSNLASAEFEAPSKGMVDDVFGKKDNNMRDDSKPVRRHGYSMNRVELIGGVRDDPQVRTATNGNSFAAFTVVTNTTYKDQTGALRDTPEFHNVTVFGKLADTLAITLTRGSRVLVQGRLGYKLVDNGDKKEKRTYIYADHVFPFARRN